MDNAILWVCLMMTLAVYRGEATSEDEIRVCHGTNNGGSILGNALYHYKLIRRIYSNCTHVYGNLEINFINSTSDPSFDLDFLSEIRVVTGYVLLLDLDVDVIPLRNLQFIRGASLFEYLGYNYSVYIGLVWANELQLPNLKEIANGRVATLVSDICYIHTVNWNAMGPDEILVREMSPSCGTCSPSCSDENGIARCWGDGPQMCQKIQKFECDWICMGRPCFKEGLVGCCHPECAGSCTGRLDTECQVCRNYHYGGKCVNECPERTLQVGTQCIDY